MSRLTDFITARVQPWADCAEQSQQLRLETRIDKGGVLTYHSVSHDTGGGVLEKIYDKENRLVRVIKRAGSSRSETFLCPDSGLRQRVNELSSMPDGNLISSDVIFMDQKRSSQVVTIFRQNGLLVRIIERETRGSMICFQGQTDYDVYGSPASTINQHIDTETGLLMHREQIHWLGEGKRAMTEHFYFDVSGNTARYAKTLHHFDGGVFSQEVQEFDPDTRKLARREMSAFDPAGRQTCLDVLSYNSQGEVRERLSTFFDSCGNPIITRKSKRQEQSAGPLFTQGRPV
jgi:hypothetical protein